MLQRGWVSGYHRQQGKHTEAGRDCHVPRINSKCQGWMRGRCEEQNQGSLAKWKELSGVVCDWKMPVGVEGKVYKTIIRLVIIYGAEAWSPRWKEEELLERTEKRMLRWILGVSLKDRKRNEDIRQAVGVTCITDKIWEVRLRWYGHVKRREDDSCVKKKWQLNSVHSKTHQKSRSPINWLIGVLTARQHRKVNLCQLRGKETGSVG